MGKFECVENTKKLLISIFQWSRSQFRVVNVYKRVPVKYRNDAPLTWSDIGQNTHINKIIQLEIYIGTICTPGEKNKLKKKNLPLLCCVGLVNYWLVLSRDQLTWLPRHPVSRSPFPWEVVNLWAVWFFGGAHFFIQGGTFFNSGGPLFLTRKMLKIIPGGVSPPEQKRAFYQLQLEGPSELNLHS